MKPHTLACLACGKTLKGRSDKKFCDDYCRNNHNNTLNSESSALVRNVNNILRRNRRILLEMIPEGEKMTKLPREKLNHHGFNFRYITHLYTNTKGSVYHFCYEVGYLALEGEWLLLVKREEEKTG